jgi:multiple sugar transport system substrate-binding protein/lactose/L-arabinose transport system substrate-binding protein
MADSATVWAWSIEAEANIDLAERYNEQTGASIEVNKLGSNALQNRLQSAVLSGRGAPTMSQETSRRVQNYIDTEGLRNIRPWLEEDDLTDQFVDFKMDQMRGPDGGIFGIPIDTGPVTLFYRNDVAEEHGLDFEGIETYEDYMAEGEKLPDDKFLTQVARSETVDHWRLYLRQMEGNAINDDGQIVIHSEKSIAAATHINELVQSGLATVLDDWSASWFTQFKNGNIASLPAASWMSGVWKDEIPSTSGLWRNRKLPRFSNGFGGVATQQGGSAFLLPKQNETPAQRRAYDFGTFSVATEESVRHRVNQYVLFPAWKPVLETDIFSQEVEFFGGTKAYEPMAEVLTEVPIWNWTADTPEISETMNTHLTQMLNGQLQPQEAMQQAAQDVANRTGRELADL